MFGFRLRHEGVDAASLHRAEGIEELALDGAPALFVLCDQVDTCVAAVAVRPFIPQPDLTEAVAQDAGVPWTGPSSSGVQTSAPCRTGRASDYGDGPKFSQN